MNTSEIPAHQAKGLALIAHNLRMQVKLDLIADGTSAHLRNVYCFIRDSVCDIQDAYAAARR